MRVLIVTREYPPASEGGISRRLANLVPILMHKGVDVGVVSFGGTSLVGERTYFLDAQSPILYTHSSEPSATDAASVLTDIWRLDGYASHILSHESYDLVQVEEPVFGPFISSPVPKIVTTHTTQLGEFKALLGVFNNARQVIRLMFSGTVGWAFDRLCLRNADAVVAVGQAIRTELRRFYGIPYEKVQVIPNGVSVPSEVNKARAKKEIGVENFLFLYAGRLVDRKRVEDFLRALSMLKHRGFDNFSALVVGAGPTKENLTNLAQRLRLTDRLRFTGYVDDRLFFRLLEAADVFVLPSCYEGHPISLIEAMAYGCVPVAASIPQIREIIRTCQNGITYPVGDLESLTDALFDVATDAGLRSSILSASRESAMDLSWSAAANEYIKIYRALVG